MTVTHLAIPGLLLIEPDLFVDTRGVFFESYNHRRFEEATGIRATFVQDNQSTSGRHVLRGLHYQVGRPQGKLVRALAGEIFDVAVDLRKSSPTFGRWAGTLLSDQNRRQVWIPEGFAHGFLALSDSAEILYKVTDYYAPERERSIRWDDPDLAIEWPMTTTPILSAKDAAGHLLADAELFA